MAVAFALTDDLASMVSPFAGENPGGDSRAYVRELRTQFSELRNPPVCTNPDDPAVNTAQAEPDWKAIRQLAVESLTSRTKDLRIACHFAEAEMHLKGLAGLSNGLNLILALLRDGWDYLIPELDPDDPEVRSAPIENLLNDPDRGPCLPQTLKTLPIVGQGVQGVSLLDATKRGLTEEDRNRVNIAISSCTEEFGKNLVADIRVIKQIIAEIQATLESKLEANSPSLTHLSEAIDMVGRWLENCFGAAESSAASVQGLDDPSQPSGSVDLSGQDTSIGDRITDPAARAESLAGIVLTAQDPAAVLRLSIQMRSDAYKKLTEAATVLQQIEPHSPIPYMIHRAVRLGQMPFPDLVGRLVREESALQTLRGEFGLSSEEEGA